MRTTRCRGCGARIEPDPALHPWCGACSERAAARPISGLKRLVRAERPTPERCNTPHPEIDARIARLAARFERKLPLFGGPA